MLLCLTCRFDRLLPLDQREKPFRTVRIWLYDFNNKHNLVAFPSRPSTLIGTIDYAHICYLSLLPVVFRLQLDEDQTMVSYINWKQLHEFVIFLTRLLLYYRDPIPIKSDHLSSPKNVGWFWFSNCGCASASQERVPAEAAAGPDSTGAAGSS